MIRWVRRRRLLQISVRTLLVAVLLLCGLLAWLSHRARQQEQLVRKVVTAGGGYVVYRHEIDAGGKSVRGSLPPGPTWLHRLIGDHYFLQISALATNGFDDHDLKILSTFPSVERLNLGEFHTDQSMVYVARLENLEELLLESPSITDRGLKHLARLPKLETLSVIRSKVTDEGLRALAGMKSLTYLGLYETCVTAEGVARLKEALPQLKIQPVHFPSAEVEKEAVQKLIRVGTRLSADKDGYVTKLMFIGPEVVNDHVAPAIELKRLKSVSFHDTRVTLAAVEPLRQTHPNLRVFPAFASALEEEANAVEVLQACGGDLRHDREKGFVRHVRFTGKTVPEKAWEAIPKLTRLEGIEIFADSLAAERLKAFDGMTSLESFWLPRAPTSNAVLERLGRLTRLKNIWLVGSEIDDQGLAYLKDLKELEHLTIRAAAIRGPGLVHLAHMPQLAELDLAGSQLQDVGLTHLANLTELRKLSLNLSNITDASLTCVRQLPNLESLVLSDTRVSDAGLAILTEMPNLQLLKVEHTRVTSAGVDQFQKANPRCKVRY